MLDLNEAKLESLRRSEQVSEIEKFINGNSQDNEETKSYEKSKDIIENNAVDWSQF